MEEGTKNCKDVIKEVKKSVYSFSNRWTLRKKQKPLRLNHLQKEEESEEIVWNAFQSLDLSENDGYLEENNNNNNVAGSVSMDFRKISIKNDRYVY